MFVVDRLRTDVNFSFYMSTFFSCLLSLVKRRHSASHDDVVLNVFQAGLCHNLRSVPWFKDVDPNTFYPRCYNLSDADEKAAFFGNVISCHNDRVVRVIY